ncbi:helix-turn-helix domain-containing protein [Photobacterium japonica]|uniref:helix-turn-helix transcriptional regulator n=1 Tax=Photobacterium japonica TaxID=2910235 RepID=UPI003D1473BA
MDKLLSIKEVAEILGCSTTTITRQIEDGTMTPPIRIGHRVTFPRSEVEALLAARIKGAIANDIQELVIDLIIKRKEA